MTKYETAILFDPDLPEDRRREFLTKIEGIVDSFGGEILKQDDWGIRKLAYQIRKTHNAYYTFLTYSGERGVVEEVERNIKIFDGVMRHMTSRVDFEVRQAAAETAEEGPAGAEETAGENDGEIPGAPTSPDEFPSA
jgi:small subunit ribosomal protein S6